MTQLQVWAPNAGSVELVTKDKQSFTPPIVLEPTTAEYRGKTLQGYWQLPAGTSPLHDGDGYWFKIVIEDGDTRYRVDPYARAMNHSESYSIYKDPKRFEWTDEGHRPPPRGQMVVYQLFQGAYEGRGDQDWKDAAGNNCHFTWGPNTKGNFPQLRKKLDYIQSLGANTIELLPVNEYNGDDYIGYSSVTFFAIEASYGGVVGDGSSYDDLKAFINDAHGRGISVIADVVFNHFRTVGDSGPSGTSTRPRKISTSVASRPRIRRAELFRHGPGLGLLRGAEIYRGRLPLLPRRTPLRRPPLRLHVTDREQGCRLRRRQWHEVLRRLVQGSRPTPPTGRKS